MNDATRHVELLRLFEYNRWAHERTLNAAAKLGSMDYERPLVASFPSVRATLEHMFAAEAIWLSRWQGNAAGRARDLTEAVDVPALRRLWDALWAEQTRFLTALKPQDIARSVSIRTRTGITAELPLADTLWHLVNHATYHRGQVTILLRQLGAEPVATDLFLFQAERGGGQTRST